MNKEVPNIYTVERFIVGYPNGLKTLHVGVWIIKAGLYSTSSTAT